MTSSTVSDNWVRITANSIGVIFDTELVGTGSLARVRPVPCCVAKIDASI